ncbi:MAG TPA: von Willebrand factor type A domain-containing protein [Vicinamibacterales bacterium]|nr:von Willebrand factor type A domain-containing protein [Vicinamibacterales bacterium]
MRSLTRAALIGLLVILVTVTGRAAGVAVQGTIVDPAGYVIPGATVELLKGTRVTAKAVTNYDGVFRFTSVPPGTYDIRVTMGGFRQAVTTITVDATAPPPLRFRLLVGSVSESVHVDSGTASMTAPKTGDARAGAPSATPAPPPPPPPTAPTRVGGMVGGAPAFAGGGLLPQQMQAADAEAYAAIDENKFRRVTEQPLSTFSIDVDTASYANVRRFLNEGRLPPADAVRVEELINYFHFDYADHVEGAPFGVTTELVPCPWNSRHKLALIGLQAKRTPAGKLPPRNLVFLIDVSGSMASNDKLPLVKTAMKMLAETLTAQDRVAIVTYAGYTGITLPATRGDRTGTIQDAISALGAGGSTNGGAGIQLAYQIAAENFVKGGVNRVILATDGDFNVGITDLDALTKLIEEKRTSGVYLSVLGVGTGNLKDATMEKLADKGNGNYSYLDSLTEARKVLVAEAGSTLVTVAKDVKIQVEFNPALVGAYRLVGYENRRLKARDFNDDTKDAGEMGEGHSVTALYEIVPPGEDADAPAIDPLKYQRPAAQPPVAMVTVPSSELMTVKVRYKKPDGETSTLVTVPVAGRHTASPRHVGFAAAVAEFGMLLRDSPFKADASWADAVALATKSRGADADGYRAEFIRLVELAAALDRQRTTSQSVSRR